MVYGGMYGPVYGSGDHIGCGIVPVSSNNHECAIYFTHNGLHLPAVRLNTQGLLVYPIVSFKGKLTHIELIKQPENYFTNKMSSLSSFNPISTIRTNERFIRSLNQIHTLLQHQKNTKYMNKGHSDDQSTKWIEELVKILKIDEIKELQSTKSVQNFKLKANRNSKTSLEKMVVASDRQPKPIVTSMSKYSSSHNLNTSQTLRHSQSRQVVKNFVQDNKIVRKVSNNRI